MIDMIVRLDYLCGTAIRLSEPMTASKHTAKLTQRPAPTLGLEELVLRAGLRAVLRPLGLRLFRRTGRAH
jgi:hypothetical protein